MGVTRALAVTRGLVALHMRLIGVSFAAQSGGGAEGVACPRTLEPRCNAECRGRGALPRSEVDRIVTMMADAERRSRSAQKSILPFHMRGGCAAEICACIGSRDAGLALVEDV